MKSCRNCGSAEYYYRDVSAAGSHGPNLLPIGGLFSTPTFVLRVCGSCGIVDFFVPESDLPKVREKFVRDVESRRGE